MPSRALIGIFLILSLFISQAALAKMGVNGSKHDLSPTGSGTLKISDPLGRVCVFCHVPHGATVSPLSDTPLWSRTLPSQTYTTYASTTMKLGYSLFQPSGSSRLCLSCHDGTIALGSYAGKIGVDSGMTGSKNIGGAGGTHLEDDHPISFAYADSQNNNSELVATPVGVTLPNGQLQCTSCHDPHNNEFGNFLVMSNTPGAPLCIVCHKVTGWADNLGNSTSTHNLTANLPNACMNCHSTHNAAKPERLLNQALEENVCFLSCHNIGSNSNVKDNFSASYTHPLTFSSTAHDEAETLPAQSAHVECVDCHNPHQVNAVGAPLANAPAVNGRLLGVRGVDTNQATKTAVYEYEICFKCHGGPNASSFIGLTAEPLKPVRVNASDNLITRFTGVSYHPVAAVTTSGGGSLVSPGMSRIYCSDCHNNDAGKAAGGAGPNGPHGSSVPHILIAPYRMTEPRTNGDYTDTYYSLCYRCHQKSYIMSSSSGFYNSATSSVEHTLHVQTRGIRCFTCHDPHGVPGSGVDQTKVHLVNILTTDPTGSPGNSYLVSGFPAPYTSLGVGSGSCTVSCHTLGTGTGGHTHSYTK